MHGKPVKEVSEKPEAKAPAEKPAKKAPAAKSEAPKVKSVPVETKEAQANTSVSVAQSDASTTHSVQTQPIEKQPRRVDYSSEDAFDEAYDEWFRKYKMNQDVADVAAFEAAKPAAKPVGDKPAKKEPATKKDAPKPADPAPAQVSVAEPVAETKPEVVEVAQTETKPAVQPKKPVAVQTVNGDDTTAQAMALFNLLRGIKPDGSQPVNMEAVRAEVHNSLEDFRDDLKQELRETIANAGQGVADVLSKEQNATIRTLAAQHLSGWENNLLPEIVKKAIDAAGGVPSGAIEIKVNGQKTGEVKGHKHEKFETILRGASLRRNMMLVGPAGSGKSTVCEQVAEGLGVKFYGLSLCAQTPESKLLGYMSANGEYVWTTFREAYEHGGVFVLDEIDNGNPNVLSVLNSSLANTWCAFADGMVKKHQDFVLIATANTFGTGASAEYVGRNQLDAATLDRFTVIEMPYDEVLESKLAVDKTWCEVVRLIRKAMQGQRVVVSPRASIDGSIWIKGGESPLNVVQMLICKGMPENLREQVMKIARTYYKK